MTKIDKSMLNPITKKKKKKKFRRIIIQIVNSNLKSFFIHDLNISDGSGLVLLSYLDSELALGHTTQLPCIEAGTIHRICCILDNIGALKNHKSNIG